MRGQAVGFCDFRNGLKPKLGNHIAPAHMNMQGFSWLTFIRVKEKPISLESEHNRHVLIIWIVLLSVYLILALSLSLIICSCQTPGNPYKRLAFPSACFSLIELAKYPTMKQVRNQRSATAPAKTGFPRLRKSHCARQSFDRELSRLRAMSIENRINEALSLKDRFSGLNPAVKDA
jgi:hypothetical protein